MAKGKFDGTIQFAALPWRLSEGGTRQIMLLTSRETRRWVIPKGWPMKKRKPAEVARQEAYEEAGLIGKIVDKRPVGTFAYEKHLPKGAVLCRVRVYLFRVERQLDNWPTFASAVRWKSRAAQKRRKRVIARPFQPTTSVPTDTAEEVIYKGPPLWCGFTVTLRKSSPGRG
jgi:8-oxo-dGTP pyrophosphatase MutT (NUDIX family)